MPGKSTAREDFRFYGMYQMWTVRWGVSEGVSAMEEEINFFLRWFYYTISRMTWNFVRAIVAVKRGKGMIR